VDGGLLIKRVYEKPSVDDGYRVLVDRVWPRGVSQGDAALDEWLKDVAPSTELRRWFGHDPKRFAEFARRYREELQGSSALARLRACQEEHDVLTLVYGARDTKHNQAVVLRDLLG
jgi:DNA-3-methyladenine glycosylase